MSPKSRKSAVDRMDKDSFKEAETALREDLLDAQFDLVDKKNAAVVVLINGPDGSGKGEVLNRLNEWLDPRNVRTLAYDIEEQEQSYGPNGWNYWRDMPARGKIALVLGSWYHLLLLHRVQGDLTKKAFESRLDDICRAEDMLRQDRVSVVKIWLDLDASEAASRYKRKKSKTKALGRPLVDEWDMIDTKREREKLQKVSKAMLNAPHAEHSPWHLVDAHDPHARDLEVGKLLLDALLDANERTQRRHVPKTAARPRRITRTPAILPTLDLSQELGKSEYNDRLHAAQQKIFDLTRSKKFQGRSLVCVFEGNDAAGKGGAIRRFRAALDPMHSETHPIAAPTEEARARPYLWRFWRRLPARGRTVIFDRSWYGRVLVERVEGFATTADWRRAYSEINDFERFLDESGYIVQKFWLSIDADEQLARFRARKVVPHKRFKITPEDWRNREKWDHYVAAVEDMLALTSTEIAPWCVVEANDKKFARVKVLETIVDRLESEL